MHNLDQCECHSTSSAKEKVLPDERPNLVLVVGLLRDKHLLQLQVQALDAAPQPWGESVQRQQRHRLQREARQMLKDTDPSSYLQLWFLVPFRRHTDLLS